jgi:hypothetical protein
MKTLRVTVLKMSRAKSPRREGRGSFGVSETAQLKKLCVSAALREVLFPLMVAGVYRVEADLGFGLDGLRKRRQ